MASIYLDSKILETPPHIFAVVEEAYTISQNTECVPNILLSGHSGSGKTKAIKLISWYLMNRRQEGRVAQLPDFLIILKSFGNAKTSMNSNSTRFGQILQVFFHRGFVVGSSVSHYLLEKSRVVFQAIGERSFHVFYELLEGLSEHEKQSLYLQEPETYYYLNQGRACDLPGKNEKGDFQQLGKCLRAIGLSDNQLTSTWAILSAILQLGNICFTSCERDSFGSASAFSVTEIRIVANLLQISPDGLQKAITQMVTSTSYDQVLSPLSVEASIDARDAISQALYSLLFNWLLEKGNDWLCARETDSSMNIIDICGFENLGVNSLEQLCRNFANELIQYHSTQRQITQEQAEYAREGLRWATLSPDEASSCLGILTERPHGILQILEEQSELAQATDHTFLQKCHYHHGDSNCYIKPKLPLPVFTLQHYAGPVTYQVHNFLNKNRNRLPSLAREVLSQSRLKVYMEKFKEARDLGERSLRDSGIFPISMEMSLEDICGFEQNLNMFLVRGLLRNLWSRTLFIRCISPNTKKLPGVFDVEFVTLQLRYSGILELVQLMKEGYTVRIPLTDFVKRYAHLTGRGISFSDERECCAAVLNKVLGDHSALYQIGFSKVFLKESGREMLQSRWEELQSFAALTLQKNLRGFLNRKNFQVYKQKITVIQAHVRGHQARRRFKKLKHTQVQFGAALLIARMTSIRRRNCQLQERPLNAPCQETLPSMDLTQLDIPAGLAAALNSAQLRSNSQGAQITEVPPPKIVVQSNVSLPPDINNYPFSIFIRSYFRDPDLPPLGKPLQDPLTRVSQNDRAAALELYKLALRFVGNTYMPALEQMMLGNYMAERCLAQPSLTDEMLCQVASLTVQNTNEEQCQRAWLLMSCLLSCLIPSPTLEKPLLKYVSDEGFEGYKAICQNKMLRARCNVQNNNEVYRVHAPCMLEWTANERKGKMVVDVHASNDEKYSAEVDSWTTGEQLAGWLLQSRGLGDIPRGWSVSILGTEHWIDLPGSDYLLDVIAEVEDGVPPSTFKTSDYAFGNDYNIPEPPPNFAPGLPFAQPGFDAPGFPPSPLSGPPAPPGLPPPPPLPPPFMPSSLETNNVPIPPAPPMQAPILPAGQNNSQRLDNFVDQAFSQVLSSPSDMDIPDSLNWRMKGGGGIGPTRQGPYNPAGFSGAGMAPAYGMPMMNGMMPGMGAMPMMQPMPGMMPAQAMMPQVMPMSQPMMPAVDAAQLAAQQQAFINQQALLLAQQMTLQATMLSQQQQPQRSQDPPPPRTRERSPPRTRERSPPRTRERSPPRTRERSPPPKPTPRTAPKPSKSVPKNVSKPEPTAYPSPAPAPGSAPPPPPAPPAPPAAPTVSAPATIILESKPNVPRPMTSTEDLWMSEDELEYSQQKRTFQQKRQFFQKMASQEIKIKSLKPPSKILLPSTSTDSGSESESDVEPPEPPEPEPQPQPEIPIPKPPPVIRIPQPQELDDVEPTPMVVVKKPQKPQPSHQIREIIKMYQTRPQPELKPFQPVRRQPQNFLKKKDPKEEALERLQTSGGPPPPDPPKPPPPPVKSEKSSSMKEKHKSLLDLFPPNFVPPAPEQKTRKEPGRTLNGDHATRTSLMKQNASVFFSYSDINWRLYVRKELFYPKEKFNHPQYLNLLCEQIIRDTFSDSGFRLTREERRKMRDLLNEFRVGNDASSIIDENIKKRIVIAARDNWENYFSRLIPVSLEEDSELLMLAVSHRGIRLVKETNATGIQQRHLKTLCSYSFADVLSLEMSNSYSIKICLRNEDLQLFSDKAQSLKALVDIFLQELVKDSNHVIALRSHITDDKSLLTFKKGDIIKVLPMDGLQPGKIHL
ncbi:myosin XVB [Pelobates cultripes]|uniref:Myosin XVB n=1 Tax=Pelobates cultripes TaxID=61616 RepID=A0AAD1WCH0_PELCU|nr:myosin XVB [Pelobates cultripes]